MTADEIAQRVGFLWNGVWQVDEAKFREAIELATSDDNTDQLTDEMPK